MSNLVRIFRQQNRLIPGRTICHGKSSWFTFFVESIRCRLKKRSKREDHTSREYQRETANLTVTREMHFRPQVASNSGFREDGLRASSSFSSFRRKLPISNLR
jgi:hypothetical protein